MTKVVPRLNFGHSDKDAEFQPVPVLPSDSHHHLVVPGLEMSETSVVTSVPVCPIYHASSSLHGPTCLETVNQRSAMWCEGPLLTKMAGVSVTGEIAHGHGMCKIVLRNKAVMIFSSLPRRKMELSLQVMRHWVWVWPLRLWVRQVVARTAWRFGERCHRMSSQ